MTSRKIFEIDLLKNVLFYQNPIDIYQTQQGSTQMTGTPCVFNSCRGCNNNLAGADPASQYQRQKIIQNTVRVQSSLYTMNLAGLSGYQKPLNTPQIVEQAGTEYIAPAKVYWNQMSDRARPANQVTKVASGSTYHTSSTRHSITRDRPGAMSPGGVGVDIKHNSYDRYLNKLKGKAPLKRGIIPPTYGLPIPFNRAQPIYGGKIVKTAIINGCNCPDDPNMIRKDEQIIYKSPYGDLQDKILSVKYSFNIGDFVWAKKNRMDNILHKGEIIAISNGLYTVKFVDDDYITELSYCEMIVYFDCDCKIQLSVKEEFLQNNLNVRRIVSQLISESNIYCNTLNALATQGIF